MYIYIYYINIHIYMFFFTLLILARNYCFYILVPGISDSLRFLRVFFIRQVSAGSGEEAMGESQIRSRWCCAVFLFWIFITENLRTE